MGFYQVEYEYAGRKYDFVVHENENLTYRLMSITDAGGKITKIEEHGIKRG